MTVSDQQTQGEGGSASPQQQVAAIVGRMSTLRQEGRLEEALALGEDVHRRFEPAADPLLGVALGRARLYTAACLAQRERTQESLTLLDEVLGRWGRDEGGEALGLVAETLLTQGLVLARRGLFGEAMVSFSKSFRRVEGSGDEALRERAVQALLSTACLLFAMGQKDDALGLVSKARRKFAGETGVTLTNALHSLADSPILMEDLARECLTVAQAVLGESEASRQDLERIEARVARQRAP